MLKWSLLLLPVCCVGVQWATRREWSTWGSWWVSYNLAPAPCRATRRTSGTKWPPVSQFLLFTTRSSYCSPNAAGLVQGGQAEQSDPQWVSFCSSQLTTCCSFCSSQLTTCSGFCSSQLTTCCSFCSSQLTTWCSFCSSQLTTCSDFCSSQLTTCSSFCSSQLTTWCSFCSSQLTTCSDFCSSQLTTCSSFCSSQLTTCSSSCSSQLTTLQALWSVTGRTNGTNWCPVGQFLWFTTLRVMPNELIFVVHNSESDVQWVGFCGSQLSSESVSVVHNSQSDAQWVGFCGSQLTKWRPVSRFV